MVKKKYKMIWDSSSREVADKVESLRKLIAENNSCDRKSQELDCSADPQKEEVLKRAIKALINNGELLLDSGAFNIVTVSTGTI